MGIWRGVILTIRTFFKAKKNILYILTSIKIKIYMTCVYEEYKIKTVYEQRLQLKMKLLSGYKMKIVI